MTEGEKTEPNYFKAFAKNVLVTIKTVHAGAGPLRAVDKAMRASTEARRKYGEGYDEVWCVFDKDNIPPADFNEAIDKASRSNIAMAYSVPCFELWFLLHFQRVDAETTCGTCIEKLTKHIEKEFNKSYAKNEEMMYTMLSARQDEAIKGAEQLEKTWGTRCRISPAKRNPSTVVHRLVKRLLESSRP